MHNKKMAGATRHFALWFVASSLILFARAGWADGTETLGPPSIPIAAGSAVATAGVGLADTGTGSLTLSLPANAVVKQVIAYWEGQLFHDESQLMLINGHAVNGTQIGGNVPAGGYARSYRADITNLGLIAPGSNTLQFQAQLYANGTNFFSDHMDGAGIYVIYDSASATSYGGNAVVVGATVAVTTVKVGATGELPAAGGDLKPAPVNYSHPLDLVEVYNVRSETIGTSGVTTSTASATNVALKLLGIPIGVDAVESKAVAQCDTAGNASISGSSELANLRIGGISQAIAFKPNTTLLNIPGLLKIVVNEQTGNASGAGGTITVNALHVSSPLTILGSKTDVVIGSTTATINCSGASTPEFIGVRDGKDVITNLLQATDPPEFATTVPQTFTFPGAAYARTARLDLFVGFSNNNYNTLVISVDGVPTLTLDGAIHSADGDLFDTLKVDVPVPANATSVTAQFTRGDNIVWVLAGLSLQNQLSPGNLFSGEATVAHLDALHLASVTVADTGPLPSGGGSLDATVDTVSLTQGVLLNGLTAEAHTTGAGSNSDSTASIEDLNLVALGIHLSATVVGSEAHASCDASKVATATGDSTLVDLVLQGRPVSVSPSLTIPLPLNGTLVINEQIPDGASGSSVAGITVNALHLLIPAPAVLKSNAGLNLVNLVLASSHADIICR